MTPEAPLNILMLAPIEPFPVVGGWRTVIYNDARYLVERGNRIHLLSLTYTKDAHPGDLSEIATAEYFYRDKKSRAQQVLANWGNPRPYTVERHVLQPLLTRAIELIDAGDIDVVLIEDVVMARYAELIRGARSIPCYLRGHNISTTVARRHFEASRNPIIRYLAWRQWTKWRRFETRIMESFDAVSQISPTDAEQINEMNPRAASLVAYPGVDLDYFSVPPPDARDPDVLIHVGSLVHLTKLPAMIWFYESVLPLVREKHPNARLELVGMTPQCVLHAADPSEVIVHGIVDDIRPHLARGGVFIAPQFVGSGVRIKILTALAAGCAVVATTVAAEGLPVTNGEDILIADGPADFAGAVCRVIEDGALRERIGRQARRLVELRFGWPRMAAELETQLRLAIGNHARGTS